MMTTQSPPSSFNLSLTKCGGYSALKSEDFRLKVNIMPASPAGTLQGKAAQYSLSAYMHLSAVCSSVISSADPRP